MNVLGTANVLNFGALFAKDLNRSEKEKKNKKVAGGDRLID